jgi:hypothetical protein
MNNHSASPSSRLEHGYRLQLNNWLQSRGLKDRLTHDALRDTSENTPFWVAIYKCPSTSLLVYLMLTCNPQLTIACMAAAGPENSMKRRRRPLALLTDAFFGKQWNSSSNAGRPKLSLNRQPHPPLPWVFQATFFRRPTTHSLFPFIMHR